VAPAGGAVSVDAAGVVVVGEVVVVPSGFVVVGAAGAGGAVAP
jgi:hypothetical protein